MKKRMISRAFTLVELLIVIAIIGVLAGLIYPAIGRATGAGDKMKSMNNASNIAKIWFSYSKTGSRTRTVVGSDIYEWAAVLAEHEGLNDPSIWILDFDPFTQERIGSGASMPATVSNRVGNNWQTNPEFKQFVLSWAVANKTLASAPGNTPLLWTRGLRPSGDWDKDFGVFGRDGGHIAYVDGHVLWWASLRDENNPNKGVLTLYDETQTTYNIAQAIRGGSANILQSKLEE